MKAVTPEPCISLVTRCQKQNSYPHYFADFQYFLSGIKFLGGNADSQCTRLPKLSRD